MGLFSVCGLVAIWYALRPDNLPPSPTATLTPLPTQTVTPTPLPPTDLPPTLTPVFQVEPTEHNVPPYAEIQTSGLALEQLTLKYEWGAGAITDIAWAPADRVIAVAAGKGIHLHDPQTLKEIALWETDTPVTKLLYLANGWLIAAESTGIIKVWDRVGTIQATLTDIYAPIQILALSPNERWLAATTGADSIGVWDTATWQLAHLFTLTIFPDANEKYFIHSLTFSPDSQEIIAHKYLYIRQRWNITTGVLVDTVLPPILGCDGACGPNHVITTKDAATLAHLGWYGNVALSQWDDPASQHWLRIGSCDSCNGYALAFSPDGKKLAAGIVEGLLLFDVATEQQLLELPTIIAQRLVFNADGTRLAAIADFGRLVIYDAAEGKELVQNADYWAQANVVRIAADGAQIAVGYKTGITNIWSLTTGELHRQLKANQNIENLVFSADAQFIQYSGFPRRFKEFSARYGPFINLATGQPSDIFPVDCVWCDHAVYENPAVGKHFIAATHFTNTSYFAAGSNVPLWSVAAEMRAISFAPTGEVFFAANYFAYNDYALTGYTLTVRRAASGEVVQNIALPAAVLQLAPTADGKKIIIFSAERWLYLCAWEVPNCEIAVPLEKAIEFVQSTDYKLLAFLQEDGRILIVTADAFEVVATLHLSRTKINSIALGNQGERYYLATAGEDGLTRVWTFVVK